MRGKLRQLFRPVYGARFEVRPKRWWSPRERKTARTAAKLLDYEYERKCERYMTEFRRRLSEDLL